MLIERGADVSTQDKHGQTPLYLAGKLEIADRAWRECVSPEQGRPDPGVSRD
jgi:hypothetical protein